ncbi:MAG: RluA family pseudouridine synthase [Lachnospiraceae bacterium]|nr:RluA family pseudouridine synthase [Lachnospiraceae bacterium]
MKKFTITAAESGQHAVKYIKHLLPKAQNGFLHKMMRKKNITVNGKKTDGSSILSEGDEVCIWFSDETFENLGGGTVVSGDRRDDDLYGKLLSHDARAVMQKTNDSAADRMADRIIYEDDQIILYNKPAGQLSQKATATDVSANEILLDYLREQGTMPAGFVPSVCNRLDRNTSGLLLFAKSHGAAKALQELLKEREASKYYLAPVSGVIKEPQLLRAWWGKDEKSNTAIIRNKAFEGSKEIITGIRPLSDNGEVTLLEIELITGKSHQIRAHLSSIGHPIIGDPKYGKKGQSPKSGASVKRQLLHAYRMAFPEHLEGALKNLSGKEFIAPLPEDLEKYLTACGINMVDDISRNLY